MSVTIVGKDAILTATARAKGLPIALPAEPDFESSNPAVLQLVAVEGRTDQVRVKAIPGTEDQTASVVITCAALSASVEFLVPAGAVEVPVADELVIDVQLVDPV